MYFAPMLSLPALSLLAFGKLRLLARVLWLLTLASSFTFYFGDQAERLASGLRPINDTSERVGMFANAFTLVLLGIAVLVQMASACASKEATSIQVTE